jgi:F-type H+-transporting ATPase subunit gamma
MAKTRALVKRRQALNNIKKITKTMELIATARFKKAMDRAVEAEAYTRKIAELAADLSASGVAVKHPLLESREIKNTLFLVIAANRGLCGGYNATIHREAMAGLRAVEAAGSTLHLELSGKKPIAFFRHLGIRAEATYTHLEDKPRYDEVEVLANKYLDAYVQGAIDQVQVAYMKFFSAGRQRPVVETLLPLGAVGSAGAAQAPIQGQVPYEFLPSAQDILEEILPVSFRVRLFKCFLDAAVSEQIARRAAMKAATDKTTDLIKTISSLYNRARQAQITKEIAEVLGGAEALR